MKKNIFLVLTAFLAIIMSSGCGRPDAARTQAPAGERAAGEAAAESAIEAPDESGPYLGQTAADQAGRPGSGLCDWVDKSDIIVKVNFAPGVERDISYETGFFFSPIFSNRRLARSGCDYRTGFSFEEMKGKGPAEVGAIGYSDDRRRTVAGAPVAVVFDEAGVPDIGTTIEITITD